MRNSPSIVNVKFSPSLLWDGGAESLTEQIKLALSNPNEMDMTERLVIQRFDEIRDGEEVVREAEVLDTVALAISAYVSTLESGNSRVDRFLFCNESEALSSTEKQGLDLFSGPANCVRCHVLSHQSVHPFGGSVALFTDGRFHNIGAGESEDDGRASVTGQSRDVGAFKTPSLRNVALTSPYMHDGSLANLEDVLEFYNRGGNSNPNLDPNLRPLNLSPEELDALLAFLMIL